MIVKLADQQKRLGASDQELLEDFVRSLERATNLRVATERHFKV